MRYGGAYVGCWIRTNSLKIAQERAVAKLTEEGWIIEEVQVVSVVRGAWAAEAIVFIEKAKSEGQAYATFSWPAKPQKKDKIH